MKLGVVITASFCTLKKVLVVLNDLKNAGYDMYPVLSNKIIDYDTRFGKAEDFINEVEKITGKKVVKDIAVSTNDGLGLSGQNIMSLMNLKNVYFVPFGQDDYEKKPNSLVAHFDMVIPTIESALTNIQIQPVLKEYKK